MKPSQKKPKARPPDEVKGGPEAMKRLADLTRRIIKVPKSEIPPDARKPAAGNR